MPHLVILSGPSCVGKDPLLDALRRYRPDLPFAVPVVHTSRAPRPGERDGVDFRFRGAGEIEGYDRERYFIYPMRGQMRAIDVRELDRLLAQHQRVVVQVNPPRVAEFRNHAGVAALAAEVTAVLVQPLAVDEVEALRAASGRAAADVVADVMLPKQIHRSLRMGKALDANELDDLRTRAAAAWDEMRDTEPFDHVLVNHDAEGSGHWDLTPPIGDAGRTLAALAGILE
jgi:guanylate kinase